MPRHHSGSVRNRRSHGSRRHSRGDYGTWNAGRRCECPAMRGKVSKRCLGNSAVYCKGSGGGSKRCQIALRCGSGRRSRSGSDVGTRIASGRGTLCAGMRRGTCSRSVSHSRGCVAPAAPPRTTRVSAATMSAATAMTTPATVTTSAGAARTSDNVSGESQPGERCKEEKPRAWVPSGFHGTNSYQNTPSIGPAPAGNNCGNSPGQPGSGTHRWVAIPAPFAANAAHEATPAHVPPVM